MTFEKSIEWAIAASTLVLAGLIWWLYRVARDERRFHHDETGRKIDVVRQDIGDVDEHLADVGEQVGQVGRQVDSVSKQVEGVRIQMSSDRDSSTLGSEKERGSNRKLRLNIFRHFKQWLKVVKPNGKSEL